METPPDPAPETDIPDAVEDEPIVPTDEVIVPIAEEAAAESGGVD